MDGCIWVIQRVDRFFRLMEEIAFQIDSGQSKGLRAKRVAALRIWRKFENVTASAEALRENRRRHQTDVVDTDAVVARLLEAGAAEIGPKEIREILAGGVSR